MRRTALLLALLIFATSTATAKAGQRNTVDRTTDYFIVINSAQVFLATTDLCDDSDELWCRDSGYFTDSMLWLYSSEGTLLGLSDDDGVSYASRLELQLEPGVYRLRAGRFFCDNTGCNHPEADFPSGGHYTLLTSVDALLDPEPPQLSPAPIPSELPSPSPTEEPTPSATPEPTPTETPTPDPSPSLTPEPTPEPTPTATEEPTPSPSPIETATPAPTVAPTPEPTPEPTPTPSESATPEPSATETPQEPTPEPTETPTEPPAPIENPAQALTAAVAFIANLGADLTPEERETARATIIPAVVITQVAAAATAAAAAAASGGSATGGGGRKGKR
jgi:hypothetical protein